jgi:hypothetical protein
MPEDRTSDVEAGGIQMEVGRSTDDRISEDNKLMEEGFPPLVGEKVWLTLCPRGLSLRKGKERGIEAAAVTQLESCTVTH